MLYKYLVFHFLQQCQHIYTYAHISIYIYIYFFFFKLPEETVKDTLKFIENFDNLLMYLNHI